jgi:hypothetical protein
MIFSPSSDEEDLVMNNLSNLRKIAWLIVMEKLGIVPSNLIPEHVLFMSKISNCQVLGSMVQCRW